MESKIKNTDIFNEFRAAFSTAFINLADKKLLQMEYVQKYKKYAFKNDNTVKLLVFIIRSILSKS